MREKPSLLMPDYLMMEKPDPTHKGKKPKAGFPKWSTISDPIS